MTIGFPYNPFDEPPPRRSDQDDQDRIAELASLMGEELHTILSSYSPMTPETLRVIEMNFVLHKLAVIQMNMERLFLNDKALQRMIHERNEGS